MAETKRDFNADRAICDAATAGPYKITPCGCGSCSQVFVSITRSDGRLDPNDARFIAEARTGWPAALDEIERLEHEIARLRAENGVFYEGLNVKDTENQRYRQALERIINVGRYSSDTAFGRMHSMEEIAREALAYDGT